MSASPEMNASPVKPGDLLAGKYRVDRLLGMGAMGVVVAATHIVLKQRVALKFMLPSKTAGHEQYARFLREAQAAVRLRTQHVARVSDVGTLESGAPYMVMELLDGHDLAAVLHERGPLPIHEAVDYLLQVCEAVAEAHASGIVHRDLKPANLFLTRGLDGKPCVKVLDFGISKHRDEVKLTREESALGSPLYMSPEQIRSSGTVDERSDVWSLGVVLYELIAGKTPFHAAELMELCSRVILEPPTSLAIHRPDAPSTLEAVLGQCFEKDRERRVPSVAALAAALVPYGTAPHAAIYAERVAVVLGEQFVPARPTALLVPEAAPPRDEERSLPAVGSATANVSTGASTITPPRPARAWTVAGAVLVLGVVAVGGFWVGRGRTALEPSPATALPVPAGATAAPMPSAHEPAATPASTSVSPSGTPSAEPSASVSATAAIAPVVSSARASHPPIPRPKAAPSPRARPAYPSSLDSDVYDRGTKR